MGNTFLPQEGKAMRRALNKQPRSTVTGPREVKPQTLPKAALPEGLQRRR
jgi:hypothetical protein